MFFTSINYKYNKAYHTCHVFWIWQLFKRLLTKPHFTLEVLTSHPHILTLPLKPGSLVHSFFWTGLEKNAFEFQLQVMCLSAKM